MRFTNRILIFVIMLSIFCLGLATQVTANRSPVALALPENLTIYAGEEAWFNGSLSYDPDGDIDTYFWDFKDGTFSSEQDPTHTYNFPGDYSVTLTVSDGLGGTDNDQVNITVLAPPPGNVTVWIDSFITDKQNYNATETINANVFVERDIGTEPPLWNGTLVLEVFNDTMELFHYDEHIVLLSDIMNSGSSFFEFNLTTAGNYLARASLYDNASVFIEKKELGLIIIPNLQNQDPEAVITLDSPSVNINDIVWFYGHTSYDPDGFIVSYEWDFGDENSSSDKNVSHVYETPGEYVITLTVRDNLDSVDFETVSVRVLDPENEVPFADARPDFQRIYLGDEVQFYSDLSYDPDGFVTSYHWDFGDGNYEFGSNASHVYEASGNYSVTLTVTDNSFAESMDIVFVEVLGSGSGLLDDAQTGFGGSGLWSLLLIAVMGTLSIFALAYATEAGRYRFFGFLIPLYTKLKKEEILDHFTRGKIYGYIVANPGVHFNSIKKVLKLSDGSFSHHIHILEREGIIKSARDGTYRRFYPSEMRIPENGGSLKKSQLLIIEKIREAPGISQKDIASLMGVSSPTINYHLKELIKLGIIRAERAGMRVRYFVNSENQDVELEAILKDKLKKTHEKKFVDMG